MRNNIQTFIQPFNILLLFLILAISNTCTQDDDEIPDEEQVKSDVLFDSIDELMKNPRWKFDNLAYDSIGAQLLFQDSIATLEFYQNILQQDGFVEHLIYKYDSLPDNGYIPGYVSYPDYLEKKHFRYELLLGQEEILTKSGDKIIKLLRIVTRKFECKYGEYIQPTKARVTGAYLTSRILNSLNYQPFINELDKNYKLQLICSLHDPFIKIFENEGDTMVFETINEFALDYLQSLE
jgi:hypothetical protein